MYLLIWLPLPLALMGAVYSFVASPFTLILSLSVLVGYPALIYVFDLMINTLKGRSTRMLAPFSTAGADQRGSKIFWVRVALKILVIFSGALLVLFLDSSH